jgi:heme exporter protein A
VVFTGYSVEIKVNESIISVENITKKYGYLNAIDGISFDLREGDFLSVFGPNGAGKSTLLKILSTQTKLTSGNVYFDGISVKKLPDAFRNSFGIISHLPFLYENLSAMENLIFYGKLYNVNDLKNRINFLLKKVELFKRRNDLVRNYSRGMLQRLSIARALIHNPRIILLDEPYTGLDQHASYILSEILKEQFEDKKTIVMVTHNLSIGFELASKIAILNHGKLKLLEVKERLDKNKFEQVYMETVSA